MFSSSSPLAVCRRGDATPTASAYVVLSSFALTFTINVLYSSLSPHHVSVHLSCFSQFLVYFFQPRLPALPPSVPTLPPAPRCGLALVLSVRLSPFLCLCVSLCTSIFMPLSPSFDAAQMHPSISGTGAETKTETEQSLLTDENLQTVPFLVLGNKIDMQAAVSEDELR